MARTKRRTHGEGTVYEKRPGYWTAQVRWRGQRITASGDTSDSARRNLADKLAYLDRREQAGSTWTVGEFLATWINELRATEALKASTWRRYEVVARCYLIPLIGARPLSELSKRDVAELIGAARNSRLMRDRRPTETTLHHIHAVLRCALQSAVDQGLLERNVAKLVKGPTARHRPKFILNREQANALVDAAWGEPLGAAVILGIADWNARGRDLGSATERTRPRQGSAGSYVKRSGRIFRKAGARIAEDRSGSSGHCGSEVRAGCDSTPFEPTKYTVNVGLS